MRTGTVIGMLLFSCILAKPSSAQEWPDDIPYPEDFPEYTPGGPAGVTWNGNLDDIVDGFTATYTFGDFSHGENKLQMEMRQRQHFWPGLAKISNFNAN